MSHYDDLRERDYADERRRKAQHHHQAAQEAQRMVSGFRAALRRAGLEQFTQISLRQIESELMRTTEETRWSIPKEAGEGLPAL